jgi:hypothetical protein
MLINTYKNKKICKLGNWIQNEKFYYIKVKEVFTEIMMTLFRMYLIMDVHKCVF